MKAGDFVRFTNEAQYELGRYADNELHEIERIIESKKWTTAIFKGEGDDSETDITLLEVVI